MVLCDSQSAPNFTHKCKADSDANNKVSANPNSPNYIGKHPGNAFMEVQWYSPGYVEQFDGFGCTAKQYCAALTIDSFSANQNTGVGNNADCNNFPLAGEEPLNWAYITRSGKSQAPANRACDVARPARRRRGQGAQPGPVGRPDDEPGRHHPGAHPRHRRPASR